MRTTEADKCLHWVPKHTNSETQELAFLTEHSVFKEPQYLQ